MHYLYVMNLVADFIWIIHSSIHLQLILPVSEQFLLPVFAYQVGI